MVYIWSPDTLNLPSVCCLNYVSHTCEVTKDKLQANCAGQDEVTFRYGLCVHSTFPSSPDRREYFHCSHLPLKGRPVGVFMGGKQHSHWFSLSAVFRWHERWSLAAPAQAPWRPAARNHAVHAFCRVCVLQNNGAYIPLVSVCRFWIIAVRICTGEQVCTVHCLQSI